MMNSVQFRHSLILMLTAMIWGLAFVAQSMGMDYVGPATFLFARSVIGAAALVPVVWIMGRKERKRLDASDLSPEEKEAQLYKKSFHNPMVLKGGLVCGSFLFIASILQQVGIITTTAGKAGFITALYIILVPIIGIFLGKKTGLQVWIAIGLGIMGLYFLCIREDFSVGRGDFLVVLCAVMFSGQILSIDHFVSYVDGVMLAFLQFVVESILAGIFMLATETPTLAGLLAGAGPILYTGVFSSGVGYTLQIIGQREVKPALASLIMSMESVFSVLFGWIILHERMSHRELVGCLLMFTAIILAQIPLFGNKKSLE